MSTATASPSPGSRLQSARLCAVTPDWPPERIPAFSRQVLQGGADILQLRQKTLDRGPLLELGRELAEICRELGAIFIVNDHVDIALLAGADGVHLGPQDIAVSDARRMAPALLVGASASTPAAAIDAEAQGAHYIGCGPFARTANKTEKAPVGAAGIKRVIDSVALPVFAIGGITPENIRDLRAAGIDRVCVIGALASAPDPARVARVLANALR